MVCIDIGELIGRSSLIRSVLVCEFAILVSPLNEPDMDLRDEGSVSNRGDDQAFIVVSFRDCQKHEQCDLVLAQGSKKDTSHK